MCRQCILYLVGNPRPDVQLKHFSERYGMGESQFQKIFKQHVGISPKQLQQAILVNQSQKTLRQKSLLQTSLDFDLSSPARLHDAYVQISAMSPGEFKSLGDTLEFRYCEEESILGKLLVISTQRGIFYLGFHEAPIEAVSEVLKPFPNAKRKRQPKGSILGFDPILRPQPITAHIAASNFQVHVWQALLDAAPFGHLTSYKAIAETIHKPQASRAIGQAIGKNPIAVLIPCHRVIQQSGALSGYRWGSTVKQGLIALESASD